MRLSERATGPIVAAMRFAIVGAGGVGGLTAGLLYRAGHDVTVVARGAALDAIRARGLRVESPLGAFEASVNAVGSAREAGAVDVVLIAVKAWQVAGVAETLAPLAAAGAIVIPLQNGVDAADQCVAALGPERVVGGLCRMLSWVTEPGAVAHQGPPPSFMFGAWQAPLDPRVDQVRAALEGAGARASIATEFRSALWEKFLFIASFGGVCAVARSYAGVVRAIPETRALLAAAFGEVRAVAVAKGVVLSGDVVERTLAYVDGLPEGATPSLQRDVVAGRPSEIESLSGAVVRIGGEVGVAVPVHAGMHGALLPQERVARKGA
jgi:2-dehydropantoate 2-reductase